MSNRIHWIDYAKAFGIFGVVLLHANVDEGISKFINISVIPLFFFLSGMFAPSHKKSTSNFFSYLLKRNGKMLLSYLFFNLLTFAFWYYLGRHHGADADWNIEPITALKGILISNSTSLVHYIPLWFIACLMVGQTAHHIIYYFIDNKYLQITQFVLIYIASYLFYSLEIRNLPWGADIAFSMITYYTAGYLMKDFLFSKTNWYGRDPKVQVLVTVFSFVLMFVAYNLNIEPKAADNTLGNYFLFTMGAFAGIFTIISGFRVFERYFGHVKLISFVGVNTLIILCTHLMAGSVVKAITHWGFKLPLSLYNEPGMSFVLAMFSIILLIPVIYVINKLLPFTVGKKYASK